MPIVLYGFRLSPPYRAVLLTAKALGVEIEEKEVDMHVKQEHKAEAFLKMNPTHTIPTMDDNGFYMWESRAIMGYLVQKYGKDDKLYPKDPQKRAVVDNILYFDATSLYASFSQYIFPMAFAGKPEDPEKKEVVVERLGILNRILGERPYAAGDQLTIADLSIISSLTAAEAAGFKLDDYPNVKKWAARIKTEISFYDEVTKEGIDKLNGFFAAKVKK